jgi:hypothetical protein
MWTVILFIIAFLLMGSTKSISPDLMEPFYRADGSLIFSDSKVFWTVCSRYFEDNRMIMVATLQRRQYTVSDFSSVLLQQIHNRLAVPIIGMAHSEPLIGTGPNEHSSAHQHTQNRFSDDKNLKVQHGTEPHPSKFDHFRRMDRSGKHEVGIISSPCKNKIRKIAGDSNYRHETVKLKRAVESIQKKHFTYKYIDKSQNIVSRRRNNALHKTDLPICPNPLVGHVNKHKLINMCYEPLYPKVGQLDKLQSFYFSCSNYLIVAQNETSIIQYFIYATKMDIVWNSNVKFLILLQVQFGYGSTEEFKARCTSLLRRLWEEFQVMNVIVMTTSVIRHRYLMSEEIIVYDPFISKYRSTTRGKIYVLNGSVSEVLSSISFPTYKLRNFHRYPLRVTMFRRFPTALPTMQCYPDDTNCAVTYTGTDAFVLYSLARYLNFTPVIRQPSDGQEYGYATKNGTLLGAIGDVVYERTDISMNGIFIKPYGSDKILFTHNAYSDQVCIIVPKAKRMPKWLTLFGPLDSAVALSVLGLYTINVCFYFLIKQTRRYYEFNSLESNISWSIILTEMFRPFVSLPLTRIPIISSQRIFLGSCLIFGLVLTSSMKGMLVTGMTKPYYYPDINTLEELYTSDLTIYTDSPNLIDTFGTPQVNGTFRFDINPIMDGLSRRVQTVVSTVDFWGVIATERNAAAMARKSDYQYGVPLGKYQTSDGSPLLHVVRECPRHYLLGYLVPRGSPYLSYINDGIARLVEAGIMEHWKENIPPNAGIHDRFNVSHLREMAAMNKDNSKAFSLKDLQLAFYVLAVGLSGSLKIFCFEMHFRGGGKHARTVSRC